jgi:choline dehydrogenase-like flavoprotein
VGSEQQRDLANARFLQDRGAEILEAAVTPQITSVHLLGTCRMGNDPATSVIVSRSAARSESRHYVAGWALGALLARGCL